MDINGTYFHMLTGENDWEPVLEQRGIKMLWWDREKASLNLLPQVLQLSGDVVTSPQSHELTLHPSQRRGAARDIYGNRFWISEDRREIYIQSVDGKETGVYWDIDSLHSRQETKRHDDFEAVASSVDVMQTRLRGLTVSHQHYLVVGTLQPGGILIFDLHAGGSPNWLIWPDLLQFSPFDMAASMDGGVCILDVNHSHDRARYWQLDRYFRLITSEADNINEEMDFEPVMPSAQQAQPKIVYGPHAFRPMMQLDMHQAISIEALGDGSVMILSSSHDDSCSVLQHIRNGQRVNEIELRDDVLGQVLADPVLKAHDFAFLQQLADLPGQVKGELKLVLDNGNQAISFSLKVDEDDIDLVIQPHFIPLRQFSGKGLITAQDAIYYDLDQQWYPLTPQPRRRFASEATIDGLVFDGKKSNCVWHRIIIDGCIPDGTAIEIESRCAEEKALLEYSDWQIEVNPYLRVDGSEIPLHHACHKEEKQSDDMGTWEWLFQNARGRYLELRLTLRGNGRSTPRIRAMRVYYPRFSYLDKYLPAVYREDAFKASFLDRYLANIEGFFSKLESHIASAHAYLDTRTAPEEYLQWLAAWLGAALTDEWNEQRQRLFIDHAELMFRWRGTRIGMRAMIRLIIEPCPDASIFDELKAERNFTPTGAAGGSVRIVEGFMYRNRSGVLIGDPSKQQGLALSKVSNSLEELGDPKTLHRRYAEYIYHRYVQLAGSDQDPLDSLNQSWQKDPALTSFDEIVFVNRRPEQPGELQDWYEFVRHELALLQTWDPSHGSYALHVRFQEFCRRKYNQASGIGGGLNALNNAWQSDYQQFEDISFSPLTPEQAEARKDWIEFTEAALGFSYAQVGEKDAALYREFLARRYKQIDRLNEAHGLSGDNAWPGFADISLPAKDALPSGAIALRDWIQFVSLMLPIRRNAHRFTVLVPTEPGELPHSRIQRMAQVEDIVRREKPGHTDFEVRLYWALFQVGSARLGLDSNLGEGARYVAIVLNESYLGQGMLDHSHPWNVTDRHILGRDGLAQSIHGE